MKQITLERINEMKSYIVFCTCVTFLGLQVSPCPVGYHKTADGYCCLSVVCLKDHQFHLCTFDGGSDTCTPCDKGKINPDKIFTKEWSYELDGLCHVPDCDCRVPDTVLDNHQECRESGRQICVCNRKDWFYGQDPFTCYLANSSLKLSAKEKGVELTQDGTVRPCPPGYFKSQYGGSICSPHSKCAQGFTVDIKGTAVQDTTCKRSLSSSVPTTPATSSSTEADTESTAIKSEIWIGLLIAAIVVIVSIIALKFACWLKRRRASPKENAETTSSLLQTQQTSKEKKENPLPPPRQVMTTQTQDYHEQTKATDYEGKKDDLKSLSNERKADNSSEAIKSQESHDYAEESLPAEVGSPLKFESLFEDSEETCKEEDGSDFQKIHVAQENSYDNHSLATSRDLGIGLSTDFKVDNEIQKPGHKQAKKEHVQQHP